MKGICPWCGKEVGTIAKHILFCKSIPKELSKEEIKFKTLEFNLGKDKIESLCNDYLHLSSLPELKLKYNLDFKNILFILKKCNIVLRTISESQCLISKQKIKKTCLEKYGVENPSQVPEIKLKKEQTFIKHYGVNNIWKTKEYAEFTSKRWASYNEKKKKELIKKWSHQEGRISKLETKIVSIFNILNIPIETQFKFPKYYHKYDIFLKGTNIIIEIQGDYWHANPNIYKEDDIIIYPNNVNKLVKDIHKKDLQNINYAKSQGFIVIEIWESDIRKNEKNIEIFLLDKLNNYI